MTTVAEKLDRELPNLRRRSRFPLLTFLGLLLALGVVGGALTIVRLNSVIRVPSSLAFETVFKKTADGDFEAKIFKEIDGNLVLRAYERDLVPREPFPPSYLFFAATKPLGEYCDGQAPGPFRCRVWCEGEKVQMTVALFVRQETPNGPVYSILPVAPTKDCSTAFVFTVPAVHPSDRLVAIGRVDFRDTDAVKNLNAIIHAEVVK